MDQERRLVVLDCLDVKAKTYPLIGIWVAGLYEHNTRTTIKNHRVMASILRFLFSEEIKLRISPRTDNEIPTFLLIDFTGAETNMPQFFEFNLTESDQKADNNWLVLENSFSTSTLESININLTFNHEDCNIYLLSDLLESLQNSSIVTQPKSTKDHPIPRSSHHENTKSYDYPRELQYNIYDYETSTATFGNDIILNKDPTKEITEETNACIRNEYPSCSTNGSGLVNSDCNFSGSECDVQLMQAVLENNKSIQSMQQCVMELTKQMAGLNSSMSMEKVLS